MIRCWPSVAKLYEPHEICENRVTFENVKLKYFIDEDFIVNYSLREEFKSSTRDWIGIFPRNWLNLQQYLTFEYTLPSPPNAENTLNRIISFPRIFHREASLNMDYQFVYVSREIQIMAISSYFRFAPSHRLINDEIKPCPSKSIDSSPSDQLISNGALLVENVDRPIEICCVDDPLTLTNDDNLPPMKIKEKKTTVTNGLRQTCRYCHRQICGLKIDALRGDFLASFSDSLLDRVRRLDRDLSLAERNLKNAKNSRENIAIRLRAYEAFVTELLSSVDARGIVQITDEKGNEIVLQRVNENNCSVLENSKANNSLENEIIELKVFIEKQQRTIVDLIEQRNFYVARPEKIKFIDRAIQTNPLPESIVSLQNRDTGKEKLNDDVKKVSSKMVDPKDMENFHFDSNVPTNEDCLKPSSDIKNVSSSKRLTEPRVLKIPKPSGILVQGKNVKFAIVRL